jgi:hypothetical protein
VTTTFFHASIRYVVGDDRSTWFWLDDHSITERALDLLSAVHPRCQNSRTVATTLDQNAWLCDIVSALTLHVLLQYVRIIEWLETF